MHSRLARRATWLADRGAGPGDRVAVLGRNSVVLVELMLACQHLGAIAVPLNHRLASAELSYMVQHSGSRLVAADPEFENLARGAAAENDVIVATFRGDDDLNKLAERSPVHADGDDICRIVYTSGTTSRPKGVILTNRNIYTKSISQAREFGLSYTDHGLIVGPLFHIAALDVTLTTATYTGGSVHILPKFDARQTLDIILADRVSHVWLAPVMMRRVLDAAEELAVVCEQGPRLIIGGGEPTPPDLHERIATVFPSSWYANVYGLTETSTGDTILPAAQTRIRAASVGLPVAEARVLILDEQGHPCPPGVTGQVAIGGAKLSPGYWEDPAATAASRHGSLFLTGDAGYLDDEGFLFLAGRFKDMIISGGENIAAAEIEGVLLDHPAITDAAVVGRPDPQWGEVPVAFVVVEKGEVLVADLENHCRARLARLKIPKEFYLLDFLPRTSIGKVQKGQLRDQAKELRGDGNAHAGGKSGMGDDQIASGPWLPDTSADGLPLSGVRVLDFSAFLPGPLTSLVLAEAGADVLRIEPPAGDPLRAFEPKLGSVSAMYAMLNRGKRVFGADLTDDCDRAAVLDIVETADIVLVQARPADAVRQGLDYETLHRRNPRLIHCVITGYGPQGPLAERPGYDLTYLADSGLLDAALAAGSQPVLPATAVADIAGGTYPAIVNILLALRRRDTTGEGTSIVVSMTHNLQLMSYRHFVSRQACGAWADPRADMLGGGSARYHVYPTGDEHFVAVYAIADRSWARLSRVVGLDPRYVGTADQHEAIQAMRVLFSGQPASHWQRLFSSTGVKASVVSDFAAAERVGLVDTEAPDRVASDEREIGTLPSVLAPELRRPPSVLPSPPLRDLPRAGTS